MIEIMEELMVIGLTKKNTDFLNEYIKTEKTYAETANKMLEGKLKLLRSLDEIEFIKSPDWDYKHHISSNTYQLYLHTLNFIKSLVKMYLENGDTKYVTVAENIIKSWIKENLNQDKKTNYAWYDHTVSSRLQNLLYYQANVPDKFKIKEKIFSNVFEKHIDFLSKYKNYTENNHGIMMDRALIIASLFYKDENLQEEYLLLAKSRIQKAILRDYSYNSTHLENSPDYHRMVTNWLNAVVKMLDEIKRPLSTKYKMKLSKAVKYNGIVSNYNNEYPMLGDTSHGISKVKKEDIDFVDYEAGITIFNDRDTFATLVFNTGFQNLTHKHQDDLSLTLSIDKEQIFVDSGKYNYTKADPIRQHMISPKAHTTLTVLNKVYPLTYERDIQTQASYITDEYKIVKGIHNDYSNISLERTVIFLKSGVYIILDKAKSHEEQIYVQNFVLDSHIKLTNKGLNKYLMTTNSQKKYILEEHSQVGTTKVFKGEKFNAIISKKFNVLENTTRLEYRKKQKNSNFITTISPVNITVENVEVKNNTLYLSINGEIKNIKLL